MSIPNRRREPLFWFALIYICLLKYIALAEFGFNYYNCDNTKNFTLNSTYQNNLDAALSALPTTNSGFGFFNFSSGEGDNKVNSIALCRGDVNPDACSSCVNDYVLFLRQLCPNQKEAIGFLDTCLLRYSNNTLLSYVAQKKDYFFQFNPMITTDLKRFNDTLRPLMDELIATAAAGGPLLKFASGNRTDPGFVTIYGLVQCSPYLTEQECSQCLEDEVSLIKLHDKGKIGGKIVLATCNFRFEIHPFVNQSAIIAPPISSPSTSTVPPPDKKKNKSRRIVIILPAVVGIIVAMIIASLCIFMRLRKRTIETQPQIIHMNNISETSDIGTLESLQYNFNTIKVATNDFSQENMLGVGGLGAVYKGKLGDGNEVAVNRLVTGYGKSDLEFMNEVLLHTKLQHSNLVRLLGFSIEGSDRLLIYEYFTNTSLDKFLFDTTKNTFLDWKRRYNIIKDVAKGLLYLHEDSLLSIVHGDIKASNVLLDADMNAKIAYFGMGRLFNPEETHDNAYQTFGNHGYGYMAPEYAEHGQFSAKSDVFNFGALVLEMISGPKDQSFRTGEDLHNLLSFAWESWKNGAGSDMIEPTLKAEQDSLHYIARSIQIALLCVQENVTQRPNMRTVVLMLNSLSIALTEPSNPAFYTRAHV